MKWSLPRSLNIGGKDWGINADYRDILTIISELNKLEEDDQVRVYVSLALFYVDFEHMPELDYHEAAEKLMWFISCGEAESGIEKKLPKTIDWEQDYQLIATDINKVAGYDVRGAQFCHWWTFVTLFYSIEEGPLSTVVAIREKLRKGKKLEKWEREYYNQNRSKIDFKQHYTESENEIIKKWLGR